MDDQVKGFTGKEIWEAMEKNGLEVIRQSYIHVDEKGKPFAGCLLTQAAVNLNTLPTDFDNDEQYPYPINIGHDAVDFNLQNQLDEVDVPEDSKWYNNPFAATLGQAMIYWFDKMNEAGTEWFLPTYEDALQMAKELLEPHFSHIFTLAVREAGWTYAWE